MIAADKQLEALRKEHKELTDNIRRTAVFALTVCALIVISFARACKKTSGDESRTTLCQIHKANKLAGTSAPTINVSYIFELFEQSDTCAPACQLPNVSLEEVSTTEDKQSAIQADDGPVASPSPTASLSPVPTPALSQSNSPLQRRSGKSDLAESANNSATAGDSPAKSNTDQILVKQAVDCQLKLEAGLEEKASSWFSVDAPIPGVKVSIDLRYWIFCLPILFALSGIFLHTLNRKLRLLRYLGSYYLKKAGPEDISELDRLYFSDNNSYVRFPSRMVTTLFICFCAYLPIYLVYVGAPFWTYWERSSLEGIAALSGTLALYCISYAHVATNRIDEQIALLTNLPRPPNLINSLLKRVGQLLQWIASRLTPRVPMLVSSLLLLLTLFLTITEKGCEEVVRQKGYEVVLGRATWYDSVPLLGLSDAFAGQLPRLSYIVALLISGLMVVFVLSSRLFFWFENSRLRTVFYAVVGCIFVYVVLDFSLGIGSSDPEGWIKLGIWMFTVAIWISGSLKDSWRRRWIRWRPTVLVIYSPFFLLSLWDAYQKRYLIGLLLFLLGLTLLMVGFVHLQWRLARDIPLSAEERSPMI